MSRLDSTFAALRARRLGGLIAFVTAGDPDLQRSAEIVRAVDAAGADIIEIGVPYSDPAADGPVIQRASERALRAGATLTSVLGLVASVRAGVRAPIVLFTYANPALRQGADRFALMAADAGVDAALIVDLPIEESGEMRERLSAHGLEQIFLVSPTTSDPRLVHTAERASGFVYAISRLGVTGARDSLGLEAAGLVGRIRTHTQLPIALGFGISRPEHVAAAVREADAAVVGSALVSAIEQARDGEHPAERAARQVEWLRTGLASATRECAS